MTCGQVRSEAHRWRSGLFERFRPVLRAMHHAENDGPSVNECIGNDEVGQPGDHQLSRIPDPARTASPRMLAQRGVGAFDDDGNHPGRGDRVMLLVGDVAADRLNAFPSARCPNWGHARERV